MRMMPVMELMLFIVDGQTSLSRKRLTAFESL